MISHTLPRETLDLVRCDSSPAPFYFRGPLPCSWRLLGISPIDEATAVHGCYCCPAESKSRVHERIQHAEAWWQPELRSVTRDRPNTHTLWLATTETGLALRRDDENWLPIMEKEKETRETIKPKTRWVGDGKSGCDAGIGPHRKAGSEDDVLDSTLNRVKAHLPARGEVGCQGVAGDSMQDPFRVQRRLLGVSSVRRLARKRMHKYLLHCGWESPGQGRLRYTRRDHEWQEGPSRSTPGYLSTGVPGLVVRRG